MKKVYNINGNTVEESTHLEYVKTNPKRKNSAAHGRFESYMKSKTVKQFFELGGTLADLRYDHNKEFVTLK
jgi:hypothetical protein